MATLQLMMVAEFIVLVHHLICQMDILPAIPKVKISLAREAEESISTLRENLL